MSEHNPPAAEPIPPPSTDERRKSYRFESLQACRALAALAVVYYHVGFEVKREFGIDYNGPLASFGNFGVDCFFVLSGFINTWMHMADLGKPACLRSYLFKRTVRIYPLLWILVLSKVAVGTVAPTLLKNTQISVQNVIGSLLLLPCLFVKNYPYILPQQWTLVFETLFYLIFAIWIFAGKRLAVAAALLWCVLILMANRPIHHPFLFFLLSPYNLEFLTGCLVAVLVSKSFLTARAAIALICISVGMLVSGIFYAVGDPLFIPLGFGLLLAALVSTDALRMIHWPRWLLYLGDASYSIYLVHISAILLCFAVAKRAKLSVVDHRQIGAHFAGVLAVLCGVLCFQFVEKPTLKLIRRRQPFKQS